MERNNTPIKKESNTIHVIGVSAGGVKELPNRIQQIITSSKKIAAPSRILKSLINLWHIEKPDNELPELFESDKTSALIKWLKLQTHNTVLLASGDPLWFGIGRLLIESFPEKEIIFHPSPTCLQLAFSRINKPWQDASWISLHGRDPLPLKNLLQKRPKSIAILTDPSRGGAEEVRKFLKTLEIEQNYTFWIFEKLGHPDERFYKVLPSEKISNKIDPLHLVVLIQEKTSLILNNNDVPLFGIDDGLFIQHEDRPGLMTKREIRIQILAELELPEEGVLWDIGAGVGSIGIEAIRLRPKLKLLSIDKRIGSKLLISDNASRFSVQPFQIIESEVLDLLKEKALPNYLSKPDRIVIGGGEKLLIIPELLKVIKRKGIIVIPITTLKGLSQAEEILRESDCLLRISQHQNYRGIEMMNSTRLSPMNPIFIIKAKFQ